jgi:hypothetical protein
MDEVFICVGKLVQHSSLADLWQFHIFRSLAKCDLQIGSAIYYALDAESPKQKMIRRLSKNLPKNIKDDLESFLKSVNSVNNARNAMAHSAYVVDENHENPQIYNPKNDLSRPATKGTLAHSIAQSHNAIQECRDIYNIICVGIGADPVPQSA